MDTKELIKQILEAVKFEDVLSTSDFKADFTSIAKQIHPDICTEDGATEASSILNGWKEYFENGRRYKDDTDEFTTNGYWVNFEQSSVKNVGWSVENYRLFQQLQDKDDRHFLQYLPKSCSLIGNTYRYEFDKRSIPLSGLSLPQEHVNWILNRILEYCAYLAQKGFVHCGLTPESIFVVPETHGIQVISWYHLTRVGNRLGTISGKYQSWYPCEIYSTKVATTAIDIEMAKHIAAYLLGDSMGSGVKLRKTHNEDFINFLLTRHESAYQALGAYRDMLAKNFRKEFHLLNI